MATFIANNVAHGYPTVTGFTESLALESAFLVAAVLAGLLIPAPPRQRAARAFERELVRAHETG